MKHLGGTARKATRKGNVDDVQKGVITKRLVLL